MHTIDVLTSSHFDEDMSLHFHLYLTFEIIWRYSHQVCSAFGIIPVDVETRAGFRSSKHYSYPSTESIPSSSP